MSDLINRQDLRLMTVEEGIGHTIEYAQGWKACIDWIKTLPSAQPEVLACGSGVLEAQPEVGTQMSLADCISRQDAIDAIERDAYRHTYLDQIIEIIKNVPSAQQWIPCSERLPSDEERKEWIDKHLDGMGYLYPCLVTRYSSINPDRTKNNPYVAKHYFDGEDFLNAGEEVCSEYIIAWMPLPEPFKGVTE